MSPWSRYAKDASGSAAKACDVFCIPSGYIAIVVSSHETEEPATGLRWGTCNSDDSSNARALKSVAADMIAQIEHSRLMLGQLGMLFLEGKAT